jgi:hypothetical protein
MHCRDAVIVHNFIIKPGDSVKIKNNYSYWEGLETGFKIALDLAKSTQDTNDLERKISVDIVDVQEMKTGLIRKYLSF